ncbi:MAG: M20/M25/M40 family metallo-hydrolase [Halanaerobiales bacterium]|nr:M20/M25/M40 family metallo-hydrolase [Halanaerobiales bacterium]
MNKGVDLINRGKKILDLTKKLINIESVSNTEGVIEIGNFLHDRLEEWSYYQKNPDHLLKLPLRNDPMNRFNLAALVKGDNDCENTVVYISHMDTVDIGEYRELKSLATQPYKLMEKLKTRNIDRDIKEELNSGEWLFGRGSADMKSGIAVELELLKEFSENTEDLEGNILVIITVNEEADSLGMLNIAKPLVELANKENLKYIGGINTDYTTDETGNSPDDRYVYRGTLGKIVPALYVIGKGSHVGDVFGGFDVNLLMSELTSRIDNNMELADKLNNRITDPPISLKQGDLKEEYNGQLPYEGFAYYNFLNFNRGPAEILSIFREEVEDSIRSTLDWINGNFRVYKSYHTDQELELNLDIKCYTYQELLEIVKEKFIEDKVEAEIESVLSKVDEEGIKDLRIHSLEIIKRMWELSGLEGPTAVVFLVPPFYPPQNPEVDDNKFEKFNNIAEETIKNHEINTDYNMIVKDFFPFLSDASYAAFQGTQEDEDTLKANMPYWGKGWKIDIDAVRELNLPVVDVGVHGKGAHKYLERVHIPYTMKVLPELIKKITENSLQKF